MFGTSFLTKNVWQVPLFIELDDLDHFDNSLADAVSANTRRYSTMISDIVQDLLPNYKDHEVSRCT